MKKNFYVFLSFLVLSFLFFSYFYRSQRNIAFIDGERISFRYFKKNVLKNDPFLFEKKIPNLREKLNNLESLKLILRAYLNNEALWREIKKTNYSEKFLEENKNLLYIFTLAAYTHAFFNFKIDWKTEKEKYKNQLPYNDSILKENLKNFNDDLNLDSRRQKFQKKLFFLPEIKLSLSLVDVHDFFVFFKNIQNQSLEKDKEKLYFNFFITEYFIPFLYYFKLGFQNQLYDKPEFQMIWKLRQKSYLIRSFLDELKSKWKKQALENDSQILKQNYQKQKIIYQKGDFSKLPLFEEMKQKFLSDYIEENYEIFLKNLWNKYSIQINESYFKIDD